MRLPGSTTVITGGASGIGAALARRFVAEGARVVIADVSPDLDTVAAELGVSAHRCDVADEAQVVALVDRVETEVGPIDLFCSNAGIGEAVGLLEADDAAWDRMWHVNVMAHVYAARALVPRMIDRGGGHLLHTASAAGLLTQLGDVTYSVTKHGVVALAEWIAITHGDDGIRVSCVCPQAVRTPMTESDDPGVRSTVSHGMIEPEAVADAVVEGLAEDRFLILPHPEVQTYATRRAQDHDRWIGGMQRLQRSFFS